MELDVSKTIGLAVLSLSLILRLTQATRQQLTIADSDPHTGEYSIPHWRSFDVYVSVKKTTKDTPDTDSQTHRLTDTQTHRHTDTQTHRQTDTQTHREMVKMAKTLHKSTFFQSRVKSFSVSDIEAIYNQ